MNCCYLLLLLLLPLILSHATRSSRRDQLPWECTSIDTSIGGASSEPRASSETDGGYGLRIRRAVDEVMVGAWYEPSSEYLVELTNSHLMVGFNEALMWLTPGRQDMDEDDMEATSAKMPMDKSCEKYATAYDQQRLGEWMHIPGLRRVTQFRSGCHRRTVQHSSRAGPFKRTTRLKMIWRAPKPDFSVPEMCRAPDLGCVTIHAAVRNRGGPRDSRLFSQAGKLMKTLCPTSQRPQSAVLPMLDNDQAVRVERDRQSGESIYHLTRSTPPRLDTMQPRDCCACGTATYNLTFTGLWSRKTHPTDWPVDNPGLLHWTNLIGASHIPGYQLYRIGGLASAGVQALCIYGDPTIVKQSFGVAASTTAGSQSGSLGVGPLFSLISTQGMWSEDTLTESRSTMVAVNRTHPLISFLSMLGPSPNWCTGVASQSVCRADCTWVKKIVMDLYPWDAGARHGTTYIPKNGDRKDVPDPIRYITHDWMPENPFTPNRPVARLSLERVSPTRPSECLDEVRDGVELFQSDGSTVKKRPPGAASSEPSSSRKIQSAVGDLTGALPKKSRRRNGNKQGSSGVGMDADNPLSDPSLAQMATFLCITGSWTSWSRCSVTCGVGKRTKSRTMEVNKKNELCQHVPLSQEEACEGQKRTCDLSQPCSLLPWTEWTPCSATCASPKGLQRRKQFLARPDERDTCSRLFTTDRERSSSSLIEQRDCSMSDLDCDPVSICGEGRKDGVECGRSSEAYYYSAVEHACLVFTYLGCKGGRNRFAGKMECEHFCKAPVEGLADWRRERMVLLQLQTSQIASREGDESNEDQLTEALEVCSQGMDPGKQCPDGVLRKEIKWYFSSRTRRCVDFIYYGCEGTGNRFNNYTHCFSSCMPSEWTRQQRLSKATAFKRNSPSSRRDESKRIEDPSLSAAERALLEESAPSTAAVDCRASEWSGWSECSAICSSRRETGTQLRWRHITRPGKRGGKPCGAIYEQQECIGSPC